MGVALGKLSLYAAIRLISRRNLNPVEKAHNNRTFGSLKVKDLSPAPLREALYVVSRPRILIVNTSLPRR